MSTPTFPALPPLTTDNGPWSANVFRAHKQMSSACALAAKLLQGDDNEPLRIKIHLEKLTNDCLPILEALEHTEYDQMPRAWIEEAAVSLGTLVAKLAEALKCAKETDSGKTTHIDPITIVHSGRPGRPRKVVDMDFLREAMSTKRDITLTKLVRTLGIHRKTLREKLKLCNVVKEYDRLSDHDLDILVKVFKAKKPDSGLQYLIGFLRSHGLRIQWRRLLASLRRTDRLGRVLREKVATTRRKYRVARPNSLWHCDGHHKLILWGFVIHGFIDGFSRLVTGLWASTNNRAATVLELFLRAVTEYGTPSRVHGDRGGENVDVAVHMIMCRGPNRASFMWGSSTHNTRIERLWVEVGSQFARAWRAFFTRLERLHRLDRSNPHHLWLLHYLFLDMLNDDCAEFQCQWNAKPIHSRELTNRCPNDVFFLGQAEHGTYTDEHMDAHPNLLNTHFGVHGQELQRREHQSGAGHPAEEEDSEVEDDEPQTIEGYVAAGQQHHIRHEPIGVPETENPFPSKYWKDIFERSLEQLQTSGFIPDGVGVLETEWDDESYPPYETIKSGRRGRKEMIIALPDLIWRPRSEIWAQGFAVLTHVMDMIQAAESSEED